MPWKERSVMDERLRFIARLLEGEPMTDVCREFGISRKRLQDPQSLPRSRGSKRSATTSKGDRA